jgi:hypothetical protein
MKVVQVRCPHCSNPIKMKQKDLLFYCDSCKTMHVRDGGVTVVDYEIGDFGRGAPQGDRVYVPFWRLYCSFTIQNVKIEGGGFYKLSNWLKGGTGTSGDIFIFVPASDFDPATFKRLAIMMTTLPPQYASRTDFNNVPRLPTTMTKEEAIQMAHFVVITMEAEKPGILQDLDYSLQVNDARAVYLPFLTSQQGLVLGL